MRSTLTTNILLTLIALILSGSIAFTIVYAIPVYLAIVHQSSVEVAREYRAAEEIHAQNWMMMVDRVFVVRGNTEQATQGAAE